MLYAKDTLGVNLLILKNIVKRTISLFSEKSKSKKENKKQEQNSTLKEIKWHL